MAKPGHPDHRAGCPCPVCTQPAERSSEVLTIRLPRDLATWVRDQGGGTWVRDLLALKRADQSKRAARLAELNSED